MANRPLGGVLDHSSIHLLRNVDLALRFACVRVVMLVLGRVVAALASLSARSFPLMS